MPCPTQVFTIIHQRRHAIEADREQRRCRVYSHPAEEQSISATFSLDEDNIPQTRVTSSWGTRKAAAREEQMYPNLRTATRADHPELAATRPTFSALQLELRRTPTTAVISTAEAPLLHISPHSRPHVLEPTATAHRHASDGQHATTTRLPVGIMSLFFGSMGPLMA